jgi:hypothetical protein
VTRTPKKEKDEKKLWRWPETVYCATLKRFCRRITINWVGGKIPAPTKPFQPFQRAEMSSCPFIDDVPL